jgi:hypothetical protein
MYLFIDELGEILSGSYEEVTDIEVADTFFYTYPSFCWSVVDGVVTLKDDPDTILADNLAQQEADLLESQRLQSVPLSITMRQARLALLAGGLLTTVSEAISSGTDESLKIEWEYATQCKRDWESLTAMATTLGMTERELDDLFVLGATL